MSRFPAAARVARGAVIAAVLFGTAACDGAEGPRPLRLYSDDYTFLVSSEPAPPHSIERVRWKIVVRDRETNQPVEGGEGRLYASNLQKVTVWDGLAQGDELGTYYAQVLFPTAGQWGAALEFRRNATQELQKIEWSQEVGPERSVDEQLGGRTPLVDPPVAQPTPEGGFVGPAAPEMAAPETAAPAPATPPPAP